ncbi:MAG TPA: hypothetical protein PK957_01160 [Candidatus Dojkabacteria bacterium]|nr:hypothetical protein [Candidatus Dojkabacteria bacterium]HQF36442.1 hypothetical protein [Candidatus Dojkabacteria bacterium]
MKSNIIFLIILVLISVIGIAVSTILFNKQVTTNTAEMRMVILEPTFNEKPISEMEQRDQSLWGTTNSTYIQDGI